MSGTNFSCRLELESLKNRLATAENSLKCAVRDKEIATDESERRFRIELENLRRESQKELDACIFHHNEEAHDLRRRLDHELEDERAIRKQEANQASSEHVINIQRLRTEADQKDREFARLLAESNEAKEKLQQFQNGQQVDEKLDNRLDHITNMNNQFHEMLITLLERPSSSNESKVHEKLDGLIDHATSGNREFHDKLNDILERSTNNQVHGKLDVLLEQAASNNVDEKLDTILDRPAANNEVPVVQMMKFDETHKDRMQASRRMNEVLATQSAIIAKDSERRRRDAEEAAIALERRTAQKEGEIVGLNVGKDNILKMIENLKAEEDGLLKENTKKSKELSSLETMLDIHVDEMKSLQGRMESFEKRTFEGIIESAAMKEERNSLKKQIAKHRNELSCLERRGPAAAAVKSIPPYTAAKGRRTESLSRITGNRGRPVERASGAGSLTRS